MWTIPISTHPWCSDIPAEPADGTPRFLFSFHCMFDSLASPLLWSILGLSPDDCATVSMPIDRSASRAPARVPGGAISGVSFALYDDSVSLVGANKVRRWKWGVRGWTALYKGWRNPHLFIPNSPAKLN